MPRKHVIRRLFHHTKIPSIVFTEERLRPPAIYKEDLIKPDSSRKDAIAASLLAKRVQGSRITLNSLRSEVARTSVSIFDVLKSLRRFSKDPMVKRGYPDLESDLRKTARLEKQRQANAKKAFLEKIAASKGKPRRLSLLAQAKRARRLASNGGQSERK